MSWVPTPGAFINFNWTFMLSYSQDAKTLREWQTIKQLCDTCSHPPIRLVGLRGYDVDEDEGRPRCNTRTRSRAWQQGLVLTCWQVRGCAPDCYHWLWFHTHSLSIALFVFLLCTCVFKRREVGIGAGDASEGQRELTKVLWPQRRSHSGLETQLQSGECTRWQWRCEKN